MQAKEQLSFMSFLSRCQAFDTPAFSNKIISFFLSDDSKVKKQDIPTPRDIHHCKDRPIRNGNIGQRPSSINPERLKDFGEEDYLNGDVKTWEMKIVSRSEELLGDALDPVSHSKSKTYNKLIRFEDISAAAFKIQCGVQKTPCMVWNLQCFTFFDSFLSYMSEI